MSEQHREQILDAIRELAAANGGRSPGRRQFESSTGFRESEWFGRYWARWSDALAEAGLTENKFNFKTDESVLFEHLRKIVHGLGHFPTYPEMRIYARSNPGFPSDKTFSSHFRGCSLKNAYAKWAQENGIPIPFEVTANSEIDQVDMLSRVAEGWVYLLRSGPYFKIGRSDNVERRMKAISILLPESVELVHAIRTDDPPGIEAYWHKRFSATRARGEWFNLRPIDLKAFKRRKFQ